MIQMKYYVIKVLIVENDSGSTLLLFRFFVLSSALYGLIVV